MRDRIAEFEVSYTQILNSHGELVGDLPKFAKETKQVKTMYHDMVLSRLFDEKAIKLQRSGKLGTIITTSGQEALGVGIADAMQKEDILVPDHRMHIAQIKRGVKMSELLAFWGGYEEGNNFQQCREDLYITVPLGTNLPIAAGIAKAIQYKKEKRAVVAITGDGATSEGDFYEAINLAGVWNLPIVFVVNNNQWAISTPLELQTKSKTLAQKAIAAGFEGWQVDGNDVFAVREMMKKALNKAQNGDGPTLIEAITYRLGSHTTADDPTRYRTQDALAKAYEIEPISRLKKYLTNLNVWNEKDEEQLQEQCKEAIEKEVALYLNLPKRNPTEMFEYLYETLPEPLLEQYEAVMEDVP